MASESQRQQELLNSGYLNTLGVVRQDIDLDPKSGEVVFAYWMGELIKELQKGLNNQGIGYGGYKAEITASGALSASIKLEYIKMNSLAFSGRGRMLFYGDFVEKGVKGVGPGNINTTSPYSFKNKYVSTSMRTALVKWMQEKNDLSDMVTKKGIMGAHADENGVRPNVESKAHAIGESIKKKGLRARPFKQKALDKIVAGLKRDLGAALAKDIAFNIKVNIDSLKGI